MFYSTSKITEHAKSRGEYVIAEQYFISMKGVSDQIFLQEEVPFHVGQHPSMLAHVLHSIDLVQKLFV